MSTRSNAAPKHDIRVAIIGAGMSGILSVIKLRAAGITDITVFEKADSLGGTWRDNTYPGLSCDVPSHHYTYSFEPNPNWTSHFAPGPEIRAYFEHCARKYDVERCIKFQQEVTRATYDRGCWTIETTAGVQGTYDIVIAATGVLHKPVYPDIAGLDTFTGDSFHTARWDHDVTLNGKRVGIIGNGSTGVQIVPAIIDEVESLSLFQRTAQWILPIANTPFSDADKAEFTRRPELMREAYDKWRQQFQYTFARAVVGDERQMNKIQALCEANLADNVTDPVLRRRLTPDYKAMCKRLIMSDQFYPAIQKSNAKLITDRIERVEARGVRTADDHLHELDVLVLATGFDGHNFVRPMEVSGIDGISLEEKWSRANEAHRSVAVPEFPNFFMLVGPNSPIGNFSVILISEMQLDYIIQLVDKIRQDACTAIMPKQNAADEFNAELRDAMKNTIWVTGCNSWYLDKNGNPALWPWSFERFEEEMREPQLDEFELIS